MRNISEPFFNSSSNIIKIPEPYGPKPKEKLDSPSTSYVKSPDDGLMFAMDMGPQEPPKGVVTLNVESPEDDFNAWLNSLKISQYVPVRPSVVEGPPLKTTKQNWSQSLFAPKQTKGSQQTTTQYSSQSLFPSEQEKRTEEQLSRAFPNGDNGEIFPMDEDLRSGHSC